MSTNLIGERKIPVFGIIKIFNSFFPSHHRLWWQEGCFGEVHKLQRKRSASPGAAGGTRHDSADPKHVSRLSGTGREI